MLFEARELKPYAEPVSSSDLKEGEIYFQVDFTDDTMLIPTMKTLVFAGRNLEGDDGQVYFQDIDSYMQGIRYDDKGGREGAEIYVGPETQLGATFDFEHALEVLMMCSLSRREHGLR